MNISKLEKLVSESKLSKQSICDNCGFTRPTLDSALKGADVKISTIIALCKFFNVPIGYLFDEKEPTPVDYSDRLISIIESQQRTIEYLTKK